MSIRIHFITFGDENAASTRLRVLRLIPYLETRGFACSVTPWKRECAAEIQADAQGSDIIFIQKVLLPARMLSRLARTGAHIAYDLDDAVWTSIQPRRWPASARVRARFHTIMSRADLVIAATPFLAEEARKFTRNVIVVPTGIDIDAIEAHTHNGRAATIGWVGKSENFAYLRQIEPALARVGAAYPEVQLHVVADEPYVTSVIKTRNTTWRLEDAQTYAASFDIGLAPIDESMWSLGKGSFKVVEYMAAGAPVVASRVGYNIELIRDGTDGFLAGDTDEWVQRLSMLSEDAGLRRRMGAAARARIAQTHAPSVVAERVADHLASIVNTAK